MAPNKLTTADGVALKDAISVAWDRKILNVTQANEL
jgi:hypothetical protein